MSARVILYDLPSKGRCHCWSYNPWKTRAALNFKGIPYTTEWLEYPDVGAKLKEAGVPPNEAGGPDYTIPAVKLADGRVIMDSIKIAPELEKIYPEPPLQLDSPYFQKAHDIVVKMGGLRPLLLPRVPVRLLPERSKEYYDRTREVQFGMTLSELEKSEKAQNAWKYAEPGFQELKSLLGENEAGPFFMGQTPSYADFVVVGFFQFLKRLGDDLFDRVMAYDRSFPNLYQACEPWFKRDD